MCYKMVYSILVFQIERFSIVPALHSNQTRCIGPQLLFRIHPEGSLRSSRQIRHRLRLDRVQVRSGRGQDRRGHCQSCLQPRKIFGSGEKSFVSVSPPPVFLWVGIYVTPCHFHSIQLSYCYTQSGQVTFNKTPLKRGSAIFY